MEEEIIDIKGIAVYSQENDGGGFETGIEFTDIQPAELTVLQKFIQMFEGK